MERYSPGDLFLFIDRIEQQLEKLVVCLDLKHELCYALSDCGAIRDPEHRTCSVITGADLAVIAYNDNAVREIFNSILVYLFLVTVHSLIPSIYVYSLFQ